MRTRDYSFDIMRVIGLLLVILAHTNAPAFLQNFRDFDVVMLVFVMCGSYIVTHQCNRVECYRDYVKKRFLKLIGSTWIFLTIYFMCMFLYCVCFSSEFTYSFKEVVSVYLTFENFGGTWIMLVYFGIALILPILQKLNAKINDSRRIAVIWAFIVAIILIYSSLVKIIDSISAINTNLFLTLVLRLSGWMICAIICYRIIVSSTKERSISFAGFFVYLFLWGGYTDGLVLMVLNGLQNCITNLTELLFQLFYGEYLICKSAQSANLRNGYVKNTLGYYLYPRILFGYTYGIC